jgi:hypothetical protein
MRDHELAMLTEEHFASHFVGRLLRTYGALCPSPGLGHEQTIIVLIQNVNHSQLVKGKGTA